MGKEKIVNIKELAKNREKAKGFFASRGYAAVKRTYIDEKGNQKEEIIKIEIKPIGDHPLKKEFLQKYPQPKPPVKRELINIETGQSPADAGVSIQEVKTNPKWRWTNVYDQTDEKYQKELEEWQRKFLAIQMMIVFDVVEEFGIDKIDEFEQFLEELGFSANQIQNIAEAIRDLDFLPSSNKSER